MMMFTKWKSGIVFFDGSLLCAFCCITCEVFDLWLSLASGECICRRTFVLFRPVAQRFGWGLSAEMQWNPRHPLVSPVRRHPVPPTPACRKSILPSKACWPVANDSTFQLHLFKGALISFRLWAVSLQIQDLCTSFARLVETNCGPEYKTGALCPESKTG